MIYSESLASFSVRERYNLNFILFESIFIIFIIIPHAGYNGEIKHILLQASVNQLQK